MKKLDVIAELLRNGKIVRIPVRGNSMRPFLVHERDFVILQSSNNIDVGDSVFAEILPSHYVLHRIVKISGQDVTLRGDGNLTTEKCKLKDICGKAIAFERKGRDYQESPTELKYKIYSWFWMHTLPLRKYFLYAHHLIFKSRKELHKSVEH